MIPHILLASHVLLLTSHFLLLTSNFLSHPAVDVPLLPRAHRQGAGRYVVANRRAAADVSTLADRHRRDQLRVAADEGAVLDHRLILVHAVVVARDGAGADVHVLPDRRVAEIRE